MVPPFETFIPFTSVTVYNVLLLLWQALSLGLFRSDTVYNVLLLLWQTLSLGLFRSDYMLHSAASNSIKQVEFNTIASGFGGICSYLPSLHR
jgi:hypothetical protein